MTEPYARDMLGYGSKPPKANWPGGARVAVQFVMNYEEGGENSILHGDAASESFLSDMIGTPPLEGQRHMSMESLYEYGSRVGVWRLLDLFKRKDIPITVFAVAMAMERNPAAIEAALEDGHELCSHGYRWINYQDFPEDLEREHMLKAIDIHKRLTGERPLGWYTGRTSPNTRRLVAQEGGFLYDADDYSDDLPFWSKFDDKGHLVIPYTLECNDMRFAAPQGFNAGDQFFNYLRDAFDVLYREGADTPRMMSIGLHCRIIGRPGRIASLERFIDHAQAHSDVWFCRRVDIARHWREHHPYQAAE
ncbi:MAG: allantoinase PuuE [Alphaproteobacteria bacterium]|jgi:putative urate catabolism protein|nr:allantoinase PuuE [Alphaproteobacteria bacterium]MBT4017151.1 allantoinase PuuE [Alphaproteobacteria bacterium]MBT4966237.1 allantoinase PuuE [Alphaproteobacteria bacterium]MBT5159200.1 allantoinase PuuE [Alphaproteobacteria bacterium]MBT5918345.1 allantoinase PuuE [Alphaproteobacteria bacterium]